MKLLLFVLAVGAAGRLGAAEPPYRDPAQPVEARVRDLLSRMTLEEKVGQMAQGSGGLVFAPWGDPAGKAAAEIRAAQERARASSRLGIPTLVGCEALHGLLLHGCTIYPQSLALAATWDPAEIKEMASEIAQEASAEGVTQVLAPVLDLGRDPRYGRTEETYGECPTLASAMAVAYITGAQGADAQRGLAADKVYCMAKHFAGYSVPANGINIAPVLIGPREMLTLHLLPFEAAVRQARVMAVLPSYNAVDSVPSHANPWLLRTLLRDDWGFRGYVYSDWNGIDYLVGHRVAADETSAGILALRAGVDMEAPALKCYRDFPELVRQGRIAPALIDEAAARILRAKFLAGLFDGRPDGDPARAAQVVHSAAHVETSRRLADESVILLRNEGGLLPLDPSRLRSIAVIGPNADQVEFGDYSVSKNNRDGVTVLAAIKARLGSRLRVSYARGCELTGTSRAGFAQAVAAARASDVALVVIGDTDFLPFGVQADDPAVPRSGTSGEGYDVDNPVPPGVQEDLVEAVVATGTPTVVVLLNGRPYCLPWMHDHVPALVEAFFPGEREGEAVADVLLGAVNPSGRLPVTLARSAGQIPCTYDFKPYGRGFYHQPGSPERPGRDYVFDSPAPLWPFGFGLSYTTFAYRDLRIATAAVAADGGVLRFSATVANTGAVAGQVVPQVYWRQMVGRITPPEKRLLRFSKVELKPGESRSLAWEVPVSEFRSLTPDLHWVVDPGQIELQLGDNAESISRSARFTIDR